MKQDGIHIGKKNKKQPDLISRKSH